MSWTKRQLVTQAFEEIGLGAYVFDLTAEQLESALRRMDSMVAGWGAAGVRIAYPLPESPSSSDLDSDSGIPDYANEALYLGLALRLAASFGKAVSPETKAFADLAYSNMALRVATPTPERQLPSTMPRGQGSKTYQNIHSPFFSPPADNIQAGTDGDINFN